MHPFLKNNELKKKFAFLLLISTFVLLSISCNLYKSDGRKNLESLGPPPNSIHSASVEILMVDSNQMPQDTSQFYKICRLADSNDQTCVQNLLCFESDAGSMQDHQNNKIEVDQNLLIDKADTQKTFDVPLYCTSAF